MSGAIMNKVWGFLGMDPARDNEEDEEEVDNYEEKDIEEEIEEPEDRKIFGRRNNKVVSMPTSFEQAEDICDLLKEKKSIIINLEYVNKDVARRIVDVVSGAVHALDGHIQKVSNAIFLIAPFNYDITSDMVARDEIKNKLSVSWLRNSNNN